MAGAGTAQWSSRFAFIMAAVGSSVGLGNLWRFSAEAGEAGGGAFILIYLMCIIFVGLPVLMSEFIIGRSGQAASAVYSMNDLTDRSSRSRFWSSGAWLGMIASFLIVSFYCVVAAWVLAYIPKFLFGEFSTMATDLKASGLTDEKVAENIANVFAGTVDSVTGEMGCDPAAAASCGKVGLYFSPKAVFPWFLLFAGMTTFLVARGVNQGIELAAKYLMPIFFILLAGLAVFGVVSGLSNGGTKQALNFLFKPDFSQVNGNVAIKALGQACFSIGIGNAIMITYGSYLPRSVNIPRSSGAIVFTDTAVALIAGLAIFPIFFSTGLMEAGVKPGGGIFFQSLPNALVKIPYGNVVGSAFFFLAFFAAITSSVSLLEPTVAWVSDRFKLARVKAAIATGLVMVALGCLSVMSGDVMDFIDEKLTGSIIAPLSALLVVLFTGWRLNKKIVDEEIGESGLGPFLMFFVKFLAPIFIGLVFVAKIYQIVTG